MGNKGIESLKRGREEFRGSKTSKAESLHKAIEGKEIEELVLGSLRVPIWNINLLELTEEGLKIGVGKGMGGGIDLKIPVDAQISIQEVEDGEIWTIRDRNRSTLEEIKIKRKQGECVKIK